MAAPRAGRRFLVIAALALSVGYAAYVVVFRFSGDGTYVTDSDLPLFFLREEKLTLPLVPLDRPGAYEFRFKNFNSLNNLQHVTFTVQGTTPAPFWEYSSLVEIRIEDSQGRPLFLKQSRFNSHYQRLKACGCKDWPKADEWYTTYIFDDRALTQAFPQTTSVEPVREKSHWYSSLNERVDIQWFRQYVAKITVVEVDPRFSGLQGELTLSSSWK